MYEHSLKSSLIWAAAEIQIWAPTEIQSFPPFFCCMSVLNIEYIFIFPIENSIRGYRYLFVYNLQWLCVRDQPSWSRPGARLPPRKLFSLDKTREPVRVQAFLSGNLSTGLLFEILHKIFIIIHRRLVLKLLAWLVSTACRWFEECTISRQPQTIHLLFQGLWKGLLPRGLFPQSLGQVHCLEYFYVDPSMAMADNFFEGH